MSERTCFANPDLSVVIPAYNEAERIEPTLLATQRWLAASGRSFEMIVVDDGSVDDTREIVRACARPLSALRLIASTPNRGKGFVVRLGMLEARGRVRLFMDADNSTPITELPRLEARIEAGAHLAIGSRRAPGAVRHEKPPWVRRAWSRASNRVVRTMLLPGIHDTQCGFKLLTAHAAETLFPLLRTHGWGFDLELLARARRAGFRIDETPVDWSDDPRTKTRGLRDAWRVTHEFLRIRRMLARFTPRGARPVLDGFAVCALPMPPEPPFAREVNSPANEENPI